MSLGLLASPVLVWLLTPFVRSVDGISAPKLVIMSAPVLILNLFLGLGSATIFHSWQGNPIHIEFLAWAFQGLLETALRPTLLVYVGCSLALSILLGWAKNRYPWVDDDEAFSAGCEVPLGDVGLSSYGGEAPGPPGPV